VVVVGGFKAFLKEYGVIGLALGVIIGSKAGELVTAIVEGILMPPIGMALSQFGDKWQEIKMGPFEVGKVAAALINFVIVAFFVYAISKVLLKEKEVAKK
jgi:large conductance mechanosensitive channel